MPENSLKLLVIGGYGTFGGRLVRLLGQDPRLTIVVGGRSLHKAESFVSGCEGAALLVPQVVDRDGDLRRQFVEIAPDYVVDASGPWQNYGENPWRVARAAIAAGINYLDLADSTDFVCQIGALDDEAVARGVAIISGLSTCPALTAAVVRDLQTEFNSVDSVTGGISPSPHAGMGRSVVNAIASYAGKPVSVLQDGISTELSTFVSTRRLVIAPPGLEPLPRMVFSLVDLPDLQLLPAVTGRPQSVWFGVATRPAVFSALLRLLARGVNAGFYSSLKRLAGAMHLFVNHLSWGEHRGGMLVELHGVNVDGKAISRSWHLVAEGDSGLNIPVLAAAAIINAHLDGRPPEPGARPADQELQLSDFRPMFDALGVATGKRADPPPGGWPLFRRVVGDTWRQLPTAIRELHGDKGHSLFAGTASIERGRSILSRIIGKLIGIPAACRSIPVNVAIESLDNQERWTRDFFGYRFSSEYAQGTGRFERLVCERFGPVRIGMALTWDGTHLKFIPRAWSILRIPMPLWLAPSGDISETVVDGKFRFDVEVRLPLAGHLVTYRGWLEAVR